MGSENQPSGALRAEAPSRSVGIVIEVADVTPATTRLAEVSYPSAVEALLVEPAPSWPGGEDPGAAPRPGRPVAACSQYHGHLAAGVQYHPVVAATTRAFDDHRPLTLSPDIIWLMIAQGFAHHVNANAETLRRRLVRHSGRLGLRVRRDDFVKESPENPWPEVFEAFASQIQRHIGDETYALLRPTFSTTGAVERAAADVVLLGTMQSFFCYWFYSMCGIPTVVLEGSVADWRSVAARARDLARFDLGWWIDTLGPILDEFVEAASGRVHRRFWQSICKIEQQSGGPFINGWITAFFPYLKTEEGTAVAPSGWLSKGGPGLQHVLYPSSEEESSTTVLTEDEDDELPPGPKADAFPSGLARVPFRWIYGRESRPMEYPMEFLGGFVGVRQDAGTLALRPEIGWAVRSASGN